MSVQVDKRSTFSGSDAEWTRTRNAAAWVECGDLAEDVRNRVCVMVVAHWAIETGWGQSEFNFNVGGIHAEGEAWPEYFEARDGDHLVHFRAYGTLDGGVVDYLHTVERGHASAWALCVAGQISWYPRLVSGGYSFGSGLRDYPGCVLGVLRRLGATSEPWAADLVRQSQAAIASFDAGGGGSGGGGGGGSGGGGSGGSSADRPAVRTIQQSINDKWLWLLPIALLWRVTARARR